MFVPLNRRLAPVACSIVLGLLLAGCGGGGGTPAAPASPASPAAPASPSAPADPPSAPVAANTVVSTAAPAGPFRVVIGQNQAVRITFASSDDRQATNLKVTTDLASLPAGWSSAGADLTCATVGQDGGCKLELGYAPVVTSAGGTLALAYAYTDSAGQARTGSVALAYEAVPATRAYIANYDDHNVRQCAIEADGMLSNCSTALDTLLFRPVSVAFNGATAYVLNYGNRNIVQCEVDGAGLFANCKDSGAYGFDNPFGLTVHGNRVYVTNAGNGTISWCVIGADGGLGSDCRGSGDAMFAVPFNVAFHGEKMYVLDTNGGGGSGDLLVCDVEDDGMFANCRSSGATLLDRPEGLAIAGSTVYFTNYGGRTVTKCSIGNDGRVSGCSNVLTTMWSSSSIVVSGAHAYIAQGSDHAVLHCDVGADGTLSNCRNSGASGLNYPMGLGLR